MSALLCAIILLSGCSISREDIISFFKSPKTPTQSTNGSRPYSDIESTLIPPLRSGVHFPVTIPTLPSTSSDSSVLTQTQRERLYWVSTQYVAGTQNQSMDLARQLNFAGQFSHPSNMCGPLAMAILSDAGLVTPYLDLHEFWNLDPRPGVDDKLMELTFPRDKYLWLRVDVPINEFDFKDFPLYTGDFIYLFSGYEGSFEHILVITRVDETGKVFTTTNYRNDDQVYLIDEILLYDPNNPGEGMFYHWTDKSNFDTGITGFGGFQLWRPLYPIAEPESKQMVLANQLDGILSEAGGDWNVVIKEVGGKILYNRRGETRVHTASVAKIPLAILFFYALEISEQEIDQDWLEHSGTGGRSYAQLLEAMLVQSEEEATSIIEDWVRKRISPKKVFSDWGFPQMSISPRRATAIEMAGLVEGLYHGDWISSFGRQTILGYLSQYTANDETRIGALHKHIPYGSIIYNKRGSITNDQVIVADTALIVVGKSAFVLTFFGRSSGIVETTFESLDTAIEQAAIAFWSVYGD